MARAPLILVALFLASCTFPRLRIERPELRGELAPITTDVQGRWTQSAKNNDAVAATVCIRTGSTSLGCSSGTVASGASVLVQATLASGMNQVMTYGTAQTSKGLSGPSAETRQVTRYGWTPTPPVCGDGTQNGSEACDGSSGCPSPNTCNSSCSLCAPPPTPPVTGVTFTLVGDPVHPPWGLEIVPGASGDLEMDCNLDGQFQHHEVTAPYGFPDDGHTGTFGNGPHTIEAVFYKQDTTIEVSRGSIVVTEGSPPIAPVCGDGARNGSEVCDGTIGCTAPAVCNSSCSACVTPPPVCGDGVKTGNEVCDGSVGCLAPNVCSADCTVCVPPPPDHICMTPMLSTMLSCVPYGSGSAGLKCTLSGQAYTQDCPGVVPQCLTWPGTATMYCDPDPKKPGEFKCRYSTNVMRLQPCR